MFWSEVPVEMMVAKDILAEPTFPGLRPRGHLLAAGQTHQPGMVKEAMSVKYPPSEPAFPELRSLWHPGRCNQSPARQETVLPEPRATDQAAYFFGKLSKSA